MSEEELIRKTWQVIEENSKLSSKERIQQLIDAGIIDAKGRVIMGRTPPRAARAKSAKRAK